jgi:hypothetical protein
MQKRASPIIEGSVEKAQLIKLFEAKLPGSCWQWDTSVDCQILSREGKSGARAFEGIWG